MKAPAGEELKDKSPGNRLAKRISNADEGLQSFQNFRFLYTEPGFLEGHFGELHLARWEEFLIKSLERVK